MRTDKMKVNGCLPCQVALRGLAILSLLTVGVQAITSEYCSSQNSGANDFQGIIIYNSWGACPDQCGGYAFAIVQFQSCWCSDFAPSVQESLSSCNTPCPGYPANLCGNRDDDLYGYLALGPAPVGTVGSTSHSKTFSLPNPTTSAQQRTSSTFVTTTSPSFDGSSTIYSSSSIAYPASSTPQSPATTVTRVVPTHTSVTTISGNPVTLTITSVPSQSQIVSPVSAAHHQSLSNGATAGIVIGVIAGVALLALLGCFAWRRRRRQPEETDAAGRKSPRRTTSVLSRTGLLSRGRQSMIEQPADESLYTGGTGTTGPNSIRQSMLFGAAGAGAGVAAAGTHEHNSPSGSGHHPYNGSNSGLPRRSSQPLVYDQRLNPSALFGNHDNGSRVSMQDNNDYSRPLGIANPDPRPSHESRRSNWD